MSDSSTNLSRDDVGTIASILGADRPAYPTDGHLVSRQYIFSKMQEHGGKMSAVILAVSTDIEFELTEKRKADSVQQPKSPAPPAVVGGAGRANPAPSVAQLVPDKAHDAQVVHQIKVYLDTIRANDQSALQLRTFGNNLHFHNYVGSKEPNRELSVWMALVVIGWIGARGCGHLVMVGQGTPPPRVSRSKNDALAVGVTFPQSRAELEAAIMSLDRYGNIKWSGHDHASESVFPSYAHQWDTLDIPLGTCKNSDNSSAIDTFFKTIGCSVLGAKGPVLNLTDDQKAAEKALRDGLTTALTPIRVMLSLFSRAYEKGEIYVGGEAILDWNKLLSQPRRSKQASSDLPPPPLLAFLKRLLNQLREHHSGASPRFWDWVKANAMRAIDYVTVPHNRTRLDLDAMYTAPLRASPPPGSVYRPRPRVTVPKPEPNPDHGRVVHHVVK